MNKTYPLTAEDRKTIENRFSYHPPKEGQSEKYQEIRNSCKAIAERVLYLTPPCREQSIAITKLEEAMMWANSAIARNE